MISDTDWEILSKRLEAIESRLVRIEELVTPQDINIDPKLKIAFTVNKTSTGRNVACAFENMSPEDRMKPLGIVCNCSRCSVTSMDIAPVRTTAKDIEAINRYIFNLKALNKELLAISTVYNPSDNITPETIQGSNINIDDVLGSI